VSKAAVALALATYMDITFVVFVIPLALLVWQRRRRRGQQQQQQNAAVALCIVVFWLVSLLLHVMAFFLLLHDDGGGHNHNNTTTSSYHGAAANILKSTTLHALSLDKLTPSLSIFWYTQMQLFDRFATYFQIIFALLPFMLIAPTAMRLHQFPIVLVRRSLLQM
jgi:ABC-type spermidine/putrescine transport system permease subunit I